ncbi:ABC transporter permease [hot springs metagenome]|uniref:ABC transporter permease n=1 Tax=hot springs metagenome TaxID=433727 RepID=A0A5J4L0D8_9ZZZZ
MTRGLNIYLFALRNVKRKVVRSTLLVLAVAVVTATLFAATLFITSMQNALKIGTYRLGADILVVPEGNEQQAKSALLAGEPTSFYMSADTIEKVRAVEGVNKASPQLFIKPSSFTCCYNVDVFLIAFDPGTDFTVTPWLEKTLKKGLSDDEIITGREVPIVAGDSIPFFGTSFRVAGTMEPTGMKFFDQSVFMTMDAAYKMAEASKTKSMQPLNIDSSKISAVLVQVEEGYTPDRVSIRIEHDVSGVKALASDEVISTVRKQLRGLVKGVIIISAILWILALLMMGFAFSMIVNERLREFGLLRSIGAKRWHILRLILSEAMAISLTGGIIGLAAGSFILRSFKGILLQSMKLPYLFPSAEVLMELIVGIILLSLLTGFVSALLPAYSASRIDPYMAIRKGE